MQLVLLYMPAFVLILLRIASMISALLFLGSKGESRWPKLILTVALSAMIFARHPQVISLDRDVSGFIASGMGEVILGLALGFAVQLAFAAFRISGSLIGNEMGFAMAQVMDPTTGMNSPVIGRFFETLAFLYFFAVNAHHRIFELLSGSFDLIPIGKPWSLGALKEGLLQLTGAMMSLGIRLAIPIYATTILTTITLIVLAKAVPQINLMEFAFAVRILIAIFALILFTTQLGPLFFQGFDQVFSGIENMARAMGKS